MSKLGKKPIAIPKDTKVKVESGKLILTGPKGTKELPINDKIFSATISEDNNLILKLIKKNEDYYAQPISASGAGILNTLINSDGLIIVPDNKEGLTKNELVDVILFN